jgi:hypothetical protein
MMTGLMDFIGGIFKPAADLINNMHTSTEEKMSMSNQLEKIQNAMTSKVLDLDAQLLASKTAIITAEANGQGILQRNWRPITMLTFLLLVVFDSFGWLTNRLAPEAWTLLQLGLGGYVVGRSAEKITKPIIEAIKK